MTLESYVKPVTEKKIVTLAELSWAKAGESPASASKAPHTIAREQAASAKKINLEQVAGDCLKDPATPGLLPLFRLAKEVAGRSSSTPEEVQAFVILAHSSGAQLENSDPNGIVKIAFRALKSKNGPMDGTDMRFHGMADPYPKLDAATLMMNEIQQNKGASITTKDIDTAVEACLACGNVSAAVDLIQKSGTILAKPNGHDADDAMSRLAGKGGVFDQARKLYSKALGRRMDAVLASVGEGPFSSLESSLAAKVVKAEAEQRLTEEVVATRDKWYGAQSVSDVSQRGELLSNEHIIQTAENNAQFGSANWEGVNKKLSEDAGKVADAEVANFFAAELQKRLFPELSIQAKVGEIKAGGKGGVEPNDNLGFGISNAFDRELFHGADTTEAKTAAIKELGKNVTLATVEDVLFEKNSAEIGIKQLVRFLHDPSKFREVFNLVDSKFNQGDYPNISKEKFALLKSTLAGRLVAGTNFLQAVAHDIDGARILDAEFGMGEIANPVRLANSAEALPTIFGEVIYNEAVKASGGEEQKSIDVNMATSVIAVGKTAAQSQAEIMQAKSKAIVSEFVDGLRQQDQLLAIREQTEMTGEADIGNMKSTIATLTELKTKLETAVVSNKLIALINKRALTSEKKTEELARLETQIQAATTTLLAKQDALNALKGGSVAKMRWEIGKRISSLSTLK